MIGEISLYLITSILFAVSLTALWHQKRVTIGVTVVFLFILDITMTIEAAFYSDIVMIAVLHVITIPAFFALIYFDLVQQHKTKFRCFICGKAIDQSEASESLKRISGGASKETLVHAACIDLENKERKSFSRSSFKKGIPE
jgi:hypothetical protein